MAPVTLWMLIGLIVGGDPVEEVAAEPFRIPRIEEPIIIDGRLDEVAWSRIEPLQMVGFEPDAGAEPSERTVVRVAYDDRFLYVAADMGIADGSEPTVNTFTRDRWANDDLLEVVIDSFNDNETAMIFGVNPAGTRIDAQVTNDAEPTFGFPIDHSWDAFWDAASIRGPGGWSVEIRIPFSSLKFQSEDGVVTMGLIVSRFIARRNETVTFPRIDPRWTLGYNRPSQAQDVIIEGIEPGRPVHVSPYVLAGVQRGTGPEAVADGSPTGSALARSMRETGVDVRFAATNNLNVDLSLNTDFAQVESDDHLVNLSRFDVFVPEKRRFFQERAGLFDVRTGSANRLFYSRRIGIAGTDLARITVGGRAVGRIGDWDVGALGIRTAAGPETPAEIFAVARARTRLINPFSNAGAIVTFRGGSGASHVTLGGDGTFRLDDRRYLSVNWGESIDDGSRRAGSSAGSVTLEDRNRRGLGYRVTASYAGERFDPKVGFVQRRDFRDIDGQFSWGVFAGSESPLVRWAPLLEGTYLVRGTSGALETAQLSAGGTLEFRSGATLRGGMVRTLDHLETPFALSAGASIPEGLHGFTWGRLFAVSPPSRNFGGSVFARVGEYYDGTIVSTTLSPRWRAGPYLELTPSVEWFRVGLPAGRETFQGTVSRLRSLWSFNAALSADLVLQHTSVRQRWTGSLRVRYFIREGTSLWIALDDDSAVSPDGTVRAGQRALVVKYVHTFGPF